MEIIMESMLYPHTTINGKSYYIPNPKEALRRKAFKLEDTEQVFIVTGVHKNVQPMCLKYVPHDVSMGFGFLSTLSIPKAKRVQPDFIEKGEMEI
jgi:hypothetical protein